MTTFILSYMIDRNPIIAQNTYLTRIRLRDVYMNGDVSYYQQQLFKA